MRLVTDLVHLNRAMKRPTHPFAAVQNILSSVGPNTKYSVTLDCLGGYWQITLSPKSQKLVAFLTERGALTYPRSPMGLTSSGDIFFYRTDQVLAGIHGVHKLVNDSFLDGDTMKQFIS